MIHLLHSPKRSTGGLNRREMLRAGGLSLLGMSLPNLLRAEASLPSNPGRGHAKSIILLYLFGGPAAQETFDPKPDAPIEFRGEFGSIPTSVPGVHFCEYLPKMAKWMDRSTLIRSASHDMNDHSAGMLYTMTGAPPDKLESLVPVLPTQAPSMNAVVEYLGRRQGASPSSVWLPCAPGWGQKITRPGPFAGWLGRKWEPVIAECELQNPYEPKDFYDVQHDAVGRISVPGTTLLPEISLNRFTHRKELLAELESQHATLNRAEAHLPFDDFHRRSLDILSNPGTREGAWNAFDLSAESPAMRERYGRHLFGECALTARRLVERGARFVTVYWESFEKAGGDPTAWDTHERHFPILKDYRLPPLDHTYSALCEDLQSRGLLDETLVVVMGEMGRAPRVNPKGGRDHWSYVHNILLTGAGVKKGLVYGSSDKKAERVDSKPVRPADLIATLYTAMGIDPSALIEDAGGRFRPMVPEGQVVREILATT